MPHHLATPISQGAWERDFFRLGIVLKALLPRETMRRYVWQAISSLSHMEYDACPSHCLQTHVCLCTVISVGMIHHGVRGFQVIITYFLALSYINFFYNQHGNSYKNFTGIVIS